MSRSKASVAHKIFYLIRQFQQSQGICDIRSALAYTLGNLILSESVSHDHLIYTFSFLNWVQILSLHVFNDSDQHILFIRKLSDDTRYSVQRCLPGRSPPSFTGNYLITAAVFPDHQRLYDPMFQDRVCQFLYLLFIEGFSRLVMIRFDFVNIYIDHSVAWSLMRGLRTTLRYRCLVCEQSIQPASQPPVFRRFTCH